MEWEREAIADDATRDRLIRNPKVQEGLRAYFDRWDRYGGTVPTISIEQLRERLS